MVGSWYLCGISPAWAGSFSALLAGYLSLIETSWASRRTSGEFGGSKTWCCWSFEGRVALRVSRWHDVTVKRAFWRLDRRKVFTISLSS
jgi:hypothetical protein